MSYQITKEDINILCSQSDISESKAKKILKFNQGDIVKSIIDLQNNIDMEIEKEDKNNELKEKEDKIEEDVDLKKKKI